MKKLFKGLLIAFIAFVSMAVYASCGGTEENNIPDTPNENVQTETELKEIAGITFEDASFVYDGQEKSIVISGELPEGVTVAYTNNLGTNAGEYNATAVLSGEDYMTKTLTAKLTIAKAEIVGVTFDGDSFVYDGQEKSIVISGELPEGVTVSYENNKGTEARTYAAVAILSGNNYNTLRLEATLRIYPNLSQLATTVLNAFGSVPDVWEYLPESFSPENRLINTTAIDYTSFVNVASIPVNGMGKQLNHVYSILNKTQTALSYVNPIYAAMNTIEKAYKAFLDKNPEDYSTYSGTAGEFSFFIILDENQYVLEAAIKSVNVIIYADLENTAYGARVQLTDTTALQYYVGADSMRIAWSVMDVMTTQLEFVRNETTVLGYVYEYLGTDTINTATSSLIEISEDYTTIIGTKGDFIPTAVSRNCEVYRNSDGILVGTEVREEVDLGSLLGTAIFDTLWYQLSAVSGINTIKKEDVQNYYNADTIYINGASTPIHTKEIGILGGKKAASRRFDIEFKTMYFFNYNQDENTYESISVEIPMIFIQEEYLDSFEKDFSSENKNYLTSVGGTLNVNNSDYAAVEYGYYTLREVYDIIATEVSKEEIESWLNLYQ